MLKTQKRLSIRATAMRYGIPTRTVSRALYLGDLSAIKVTTETGRERFYILVDDADIWFNSLSLNTASVSVGGTK
jgi:hypothetical protein